MQFTFLSVILLFYLYHTFILKLDYIWYYRTYQLTLTLIGKWIPEYFQTHDVNSLDEKSLRDFLIFHVDQYRRLAEVEEVCLDSKNLQITFYRSIYQQYQGCLAELNINEEFIKTYQELLIEIIRRYQPLSSPTTITSPEKLNSSDIIDIFEYNPDPDDDDIIDFLLVYDFGFLDDPKTPAEEKYYREGIHLVYQLTHHDLNKYRQVITRTVMFDFSKANGDNLEEYFVRMKGFNDNTIITHQLFLDFLIWLGWDEAEVTKINSTAIYGSLGEIKCLDPIYIYHRRIKDFQERRGAKIIQRAWTKYWYHPNETGESRYSRYMSHLDLV